MKVRTRFDRNGRQGVALLCAVVAAFVAASMVSLMLTLALVSDKTANLKRNGARAQYLSEGAVEAAKKQIQTSIANWSAVPASGSTTIDGQQIDYTITPTGFSTTRTDEAGIQSLVSGYEVAANSMVQRSAARASRIINVEATPLFQYAVFYTNDLEILPGPDMTLKGRVHSNANMYLGCGQKLTINSNYVHAVGNIYRNRKDDPTNSSGTVDIRKWVSNPFDVLEPSAYFTMQSQTQMASLGVTTASGFDSRFTSGFDSNANGDYSDAGDWLPWSTGALEYWKTPVGYTGGSGHTVLSADQGVTEAVTPQAASIQMYEELVGDTGGNFMLDTVTHEYVPCTPGTGAYGKGFYHAHAGLNVITKANHTWKAYDGAGVDVTALLGSAVTVTQSIYDARQAGSSSANIWTTNIDIAALAATGKFPSNGLIYAAQYGEGTDNAAQGVQLKNGSILPAALTVVSEDPIYVQGDYNKGDLTHPKKGAALIGDAINLLSNAWDDSKTKTGTLPVAANTTYNAAMMCGNQSSSIGNYNGGFENLPRFHENWTNKVATITGAFVNAWFSRFATGSWIYGGNRYTAPSRNWSYDPAFNTVANLPPFTPLAVSAHDVVSW